MNTVSRHLVAVTLLISLAACGRDTPASDGHKDHTHGGGAAASEPAKSPSYTCPMHPEVVSNAPGKCPKCEMDLVLKQ
jgi:hypothetical protein